jgi:hypothetical protein
MSRIRLPVSIQTAGTGLEIPAFLTVNARSCTRRLFSNQSASHSLTLRGKDLRRLCPAECPDYFFGFRLPLARFFAAASAPSALAMSCGGASSSNPAIFASW